MKRGNTTPSGCAAAGLALLLFSGCGGGSDVGEGDLVVELNDPAFSGPQGAAPAPPAPAAAEAPAPAPAGGEPGFLAQAAAPGGSPAGAPASGGLTLTQPPGDSATTDATTAPAASGSLTGVEGGANGLALNEMLSAANAANDPSAVRPEPSSSAAPGADASGYGGSDEAQMRAMMGGGPPPGMMGGGPPPDASMYGGELSGTEGGYGEMSGMAGMMEGQGPGGFEPGFGGGGGQFGGGGGSGKAADFSTPIGAVNAFLEAAEARDIRRLSEATALRAPMEADTKSRRETFQAIREEALTPEEIEAIGADLDDFQVAGMNQVRSSGAASFTLTKPGDYGSTLQRRIVVRREKDGWKVRDVTGTAEIKQLGGRLMQRNNNGGSRSGGPR